MALSKQEFSNYIKQFNFRELFNDMGWNNDRTSQPIVVDNETYTLQAIAEKNGFKILLCHPPANGIIPDYNIRKKIETKVTKLFQEHLIIYFDAKKTEQIWQLVVRQSGKPAKVTETRWHIDQDPQLLYQRASGVFFELDEEERITIIDVTKRVAENFQQNNEKVTKRFYDQFKKEHGSFLQFIKGISERTNQEWYASLMLNRLMFCYFIQKKGFLNNDKNYLRNKLNECKEKRGKVKFYSFYRDFLLVLFHQGLNNPAQSPETIVEIGKIPFLNGGLFDEHELEKTYAKIDIDDKAFDNIFNFFDQYEWHLDTRVTATGRDINPDVIGYIFEKYINDRANMGAYYTKEDITDYISKNCIIPYLFDEVARNNQENHIKIIVQTSGDEYIYDAVKKGVELPLPDEIEIGVNTALPDLIERRKGWNKPAPAEYALPTEIWREVVERRNRYTEVKSKIDNGEITTINDFITYNLNIRQFAQDVIENTNDPDFLKAFYKALTHVTILDPTCGSGAFLFAAMNILEPLYEACIGRMRAFAEDEDRENYLARHCGLDPQSPQKNSIFKNRYKYFREVLENIQNPQHPNLQYFIYKSIILNNLYGVDIMKEAVEIAKLRLFLKLVATVDADYGKPNLGLEPLPDIDFNIRAGNTLVGFATEAELTKAFEGTVDFDNSKGKLEEKCETVALAFKRYKEIQLTYGDDFADFKTAKEELNKRLNELNGELNLLLHKQANVIPYDTWLQTHQPFHWFAEFYEIVQGNGGFDVIIGNPPYVEYGKVKSTYKLYDYNTIECNNLWVYVVENTLKIGNTKGYISFIVPMSLTSSKRMLPIQKILRKNRFTWISNFESGSNPGQLFIGVKQSLSILISKISKTNRLYCSKYLRFYQEERNNVFYKLNLQEITNENFIDYGFYKIGSELQLELIKKLFLHASLCLQMIQFGNHKLFVHRIASYYIKCFDKAPFFKNDRDGEKKSDDYKEYYFSEDKLQFVAVINSSIFYMYWQVFFDNFKAGKFCIESFPFSKITNNEMIKKLSGYSQLLMNDMKNKSERISVFYKATGNVEYDNFYPRLSKSIIDEIDTVLAQHYGFTEEELDFIINYDIKYRMGRELEEE